MSPHGICTTCPNGKISPGPPGLQCTDCHANQISNSNSSACVCTSGHYNHVQLGIITCTDNDWTVDSFFHDETYKVAKGELLDLGLQCIPCPPCLECLNHHDEVDDLTVSDSGLIRLKEGFQSLVEASNYHSSIADLHSTNTTSFLRCRPAAADLDNYTDDGIAPPRCLGGIFDDEGHAPPAHCRELHDETSMLCFGCIEGYGRAGDSECESCSSTFAATVAAAMAGIAMAVIIGLSVKNLCLQRMGTNGASPSVVESTENTHGVVNPVTASTDAVILGATFDTGSTNLLTGMGTQVLQTAQVLGSGKRMLSTLVSVSLQPMKIFISYWQIVANIGAVLHFQFPPVLTSWIAFFRPVVVNLRQLFNLECAGLDTFYKMWLIEVFVVPAVLFAFLYLFYAYQQRARGGSATAVQLSSLCES